MKKLIQLVLLTGIFITAHAQEFSRAAFSIGPEVALPSNSVYNIGYGASAKFEIPVIDKFSLSLTGGYSRLHHKNPFIGTTTAQPESVFVPLKAGVRYGARGGLYLEGEMGSVMETTDAKRSLFAFSVGPGFMFRVSDKQAVDLGFRYEKWSDNSLTQTGLRVAYRLGW